MSRTVRSTIEPATIYVDAIKSGKCRLLCRWDIHRVEIEDEQGTRQEWEYQEQVIEGWTLDDAAYLERVNDRQRLTDAGRKYFAMNEAVILEWAKAAAV